MTNPRDVSEVFSTVRLDLDKAKSAEIVKKGMWQSEGSILWNLLDSNLKVLISVVFRYNSRETVSFPDTSALWTLIEKWKPQRNGELFCKFEKLNKSNINKSFSIHCWLEHLLFFTRNFPVSKSIRKVKHLRQSLKIANRLTELLLNCEFNHWDHNL